MRTTNGNSYTEEPITYQPHKAKTVGSVYSIEASATKNGPLVSVVNYEDAEWT